MSKRRTPLEAAAGKLISAIQKEWGELAGEPAAQDAEEVMNRAHELLQASASDSVQGLLAGRSVREFLDAVWVEMHPAVVPYTEAFDAALRDSNHA
jgi:hypothetical protein